MFTTKCLKNTFTTNLLRIVSILFILLFLASPAHAGTPVVDTQIDFNPSMYPGESTTMGVLVSEISGSDWVKDATVSIQVSPSSGVVMTSPSQSVSRIEKGSSKYFYFPIELTDTAASGTRTIYVTVKYYEMDLLNINTLGPYYTQDDQYFTVNNPYGQIVVSTTPSSVDVYLDGQYMGKSPMTISSVVQGKHTVVLKKDGYNEISANVDVDADSQCSIIRALSQKTGSVSISTTPSGTSVKIDGKYAGVSPLTVNKLAPGSHEISISINGYRDVSDSFYITAGTSTTYPKTLVKESGNIDIDSTPSGASVYLESAYKGVTPLYIESVSPGTYNIKLVMAGYKDLQRTVTIKDGSTASVSVSPERLSLTESVAATVSGKSTSSSIVHSSSTSDSSTSNTQLLAGILLVIAILIAIGFAKRTIKNRDKKTTPLDNQAVIQNIHYGDRIETHIKDSIVQRSNIGSRPESCPYCSSSMPTEGNFCAACGKKTK